MIPRGLSQKTLTNVLTRMSEDEFQQFSQALADENWEANWNNFLKSSRNQGLKTFFEGHKLELDVYGNSKIFKISDIKTMSPVVALKMVVQPLSPKEKIIQKKTDVVSAIDEINRVVRYKLASNQIVADGRMHLVPYYPLGSVDQYGSRFNTQDRRDNASAIFTKMAIALQQIQASGHMFTDVKNSNWLIDSQGNLAITDVKCFKSINQRGEYHSSEFMMFTVPMTPPEIRIPGKNILKGSSDTIHCSAESVHAYMLGKNIYQYLTQCKLNNFYQPDAHKLRHRGCDVCDNAQELDYSHEVFKGPAGSKGAAYKSLIEGLIHEDPAQRMSLSAIQGVLKHIDSLPQYIEDYSFKKTGQAKYTVPEATVVNKVDPGVTLVNERDPEATLVNERDSEATLVNELDLEATLVKEVDSEAHLVAEKSKTKDLERCFQDTVLQIKEVTKNSKRNEVQPLDVEEKLESGAKKISITASFKDRLLSIKKFITDKIYKTDQQQSDGNKEHTKSPRR